METPTETMPACTIPQMTFAEVARYRQRGYEAPVLQAIDAHVAHCNVCRAALARFDALRAAARHALAPVAAAEDAGDTAFIDEALLAAYAEGTLAAPEAAAVAARLTAAPALYRHYAGLERERSAPVTARYRAPLDALASVMAPEPAAPVRDRPALALRLHARAAAWRDALVEQVSPRRLAVPAFAFALGVLLVLVALPRPEPATLVPLAGPAAATPGGRVLSGLPGEDAPEAATVVLPAGDVTFAWPATPGAARYDARVYDAAGNLVHVADDLAGPRWATSLAALDGDAPFTLVVTADYTAGGTGPVARLVFVASGAEE